MKKQKYALNYRNRPTDMQIYKRTHTRKKITASDFESRTRNRHNSTSHILLYTPAYFMRNEYDIRQWGGRGLFAPSIVSPVSFQSFRIPDTYHFYSNNRSPHRRNRLQVIPGVAVEKNTRISSFGPVFVWAPTPDFDRHCPYLRQFFGRFRGAGVCVWQNQPLLPEPRPN